MREYSDCFKFNHLYSEDLEDKFRELEKNAIDVLRRLMTDDIDDKTMDEESINVLRKYILLQMMRTPSEKPVSWAESTWNRWMRMSFRPHLAILVTGRRMSSGTT